MYFHLYHELINLKLICENHDNLHIFRQFPNNVLNHLN